MMVLLFSFMLVTNLFLLNVFLGVVTSAYSEMVKQFYLGKYEVCEALLTSAFKLIATGESDKGITKQGKASVQPHPLVLLLLYVCICVHTCM